MKTVSGAGILCLLWRDQYSANELTQVPRKFPVIRGESRKTKTYAKVGLMREERRRENFSRLLSFSAFCGKRLVAP